MSYKRIYIPNIAYISQYALKQFIIENSDNNISDLMMGWIMKDMFENRQKLYCQRNQYKDEDEKYYKKEHWKWIRAFYEAYPEYDSIMFEYDN